MAVEPLDLGRLTPENFTTLHGFTVEAETRAHAVGLPPLLMELVRLRASQLNGCDLCLSLHTDQARDRGEDPQRLAELAEWRNSEKFTDPERAALSFTETVTVLDNGVSVADHESLREHFDDAQRAHLLWTIVLINTYNRLGVATRPTA